VIDLAAPTPPTLSPTSFSRPGWDKAGGFEAVHYDQGDWERTLRAWPAHIPFE
jgi:hypothetical protein